jgi:integrase
MADDPRLSDDEVRAAARRWLMVPGRTYTSIVDSLLPGELSRERVGLAERLLEWTPDRLAAEDLPPYFASTQARMEAEDALALSGFEPQIESKRSRPADPVRRASSSSGPRRPPPLPEISRLVWHPDDIARMQAAMRAVLDEYIKGRWSTMIGDERSTDGARASPAPTWSPLPAAAHFEAFLAEKKRRTVEHRAWTAQTTSQARASLRLLEGLVGAKAVGEYVRADAGKLRELLLRVPASFGKGRETDPTRAIADADARDAAIRRAREDAPDSQLAHSAPSRRMSMKTTKRHFSALSQFWDWLKVYGHVAEDIFLGWKFPGTKSKKVKKRHPWPKIYLGVLFQSDQWRSADVYSADHWLPLIALHSGMRLDEIANIRITNDIKNDGGIYYFHIQERPIDDDDDHWEAKSNDHWEAKSEASYRRVPIHSWLIRHGILALGEHRKKLGAVMLFPDLSPSGPDGKRSAAYSREFSRLKKRLGIPAGIVFHSFRHTFRSKVAQAEWQKRHIDAVVGHEDDGDQSVGPTYEHVETYELSILRDVVESFASPLDLGFIKPISRSRR